MGSDKIIIAPQIDMPLSSAKPTGKIALSQILGQIATTDQGNYYYSSMSTYASPEVKRTPANDLSNSDEGRFSKSDNRL